MTLREEIQALSGLIACLRRGGWFGVRGELKDRARKIVGLKRERANLILWLRRRRPRRAIA